MSARTYLLILFLADSAGFLLLGWGLERWGGGEVDWGRVVGVALLMGIVTADMARRLGGVEAGEVRAGFGAYRVATRWMLVFWGSLLAALGLSCLAVAAFS